MKWAPVPWKSSDFAPRGISFPEKLCYTTHITVKFLPFCQLGFVSAIPAPPQNQFAPQTLSQSLTTQGFGRAGSLFIFPRKGTETFLSFSLTACGLFDHYLYFPVRGRKH